MSGATRRRARKMRGAWNTLVTISKSSKIGVFTVSRGSK